MYFNIKNYLKNNKYYIAKYTLRMKNLCGPWVPKLCALGAQTLCFRLLLFVSRMGSVF